MRMEGRSKLGFGILLVAALLVTPAFAQMGGQGPAELQQKLAALKQSATQNKQRLHQYQWVETQQLTLKGDPKPAKSNLCSYAPNGQLQKVPIGEQQPQQQPQQQGQRGGRLKARVVEKKTEEMQDYMQQVKSVISLYVPPDAQHMQKAFQAHNVSLNSTMGAGAAQLIFKNYAQPGDQMTIAFDPATKKIQTLNVNTYLSDPNDAITLAVKFASLPDGTNYAAQTVLNAPSKEIQVTTTNANYSKLAH